MGNTTNICMIPDDISIQITRVKNVPQKTFDVYIISAPNEFNGISFYILYTFYEVSKEQKWIFSCELSAITLKRSKARART